MTKKMLEEFSPYLDAANIDLKAFREETYKKYVGASLKPVLASLKKIKRLAIWLEVTTLVIPGINDDQAELKDVADFIVQELGVETPWHISRFRPAYKMTGVPPTPLSKLEEASAIGREAGLRHVCLGNAVGGEDTFCHHCGALLIRRSGCSVAENRIQVDGRCPSCGAIIAGVGIGSGNAGPNESGAS
jgi:pyruvate formate lyase activating enzyme